VKPPDLPEDLKAIERDLAARPRPAPSEALRQRILAAARRDLSSPAAPEQRRLGTWEFALAAAAVALLVTNLAMSAANDMTWSRRPALDRNAVAAAAEEISRLAPQLAPQEARREALILVAGSPLPMVLEVNIKPGEAPWMRPDRQELLLPDATDVKP
jgi:hypothetical protein